MNVFQYRKKGICRNEPGDSFQTFCLAVKKPKIWNSLDAVFLNNFFFKIKIDPNRDKMCVEIGKNLGLDQNLVQFAAVRSPIRPEIEEHLFIRFAGSN